MNNIKSLTCVWMVLLCIVFFTSCVQRVGKNESVSESKEQPDWFSSYYELKTVEGYEKPEGFDWYMRNIQRFEDAALVNANLRSVRELGPTNIAGRVRAFIFDRTTEDRYLAGGISGGLWESLDAGASWHPYAIHDQNVNISYIDQSTLDPNLVYYCTGEVTGNSAGIGGVGVFRSRDAGKNFELLENTALIYNRTWRVVCSKSDTNTVYLAHSGGLSYSENQGEDWDDLIFSQVTDIEVLPNGAVWAGVKDLGVMYSPTGKPNSFLFVRNDVLPEEGFARVELAVAPSDTNTVYIAYEDEATDGLLDIFKTTDGGQSWTRLTNPQDQDIYFNYSWYCLALAVHPTDPNMVFIGSVGIGYSLDGGQSWQVMQGPGHVDRHIFAFDPFDDTRFIVGSDGGLHEGYTGETPIRTIESLNNGLNITQFYTGSYHPTEDIVMGGTQDNGTLLSSENTQAFQHIFGGDGSFNIINPDDVDNAYVSYQRGYAFRSNDFTNPLRDWTYIMDDLDADNDGSLDDDTYFINPLYIDRVHTDRIFFPTRERVWASDNRGDNWYQLTDPIEDPYVIKTKAVDDSTTLAFLAGIAVFYRIDNLQQHSAGAEVDLSNTMPEEIEEGFIKDFSFHPLYDSVLYISLSSYSNEPRVWKITDALSDSPQWESISGDLPAGLPVNGIVAIPSQPGFMAIATDYGVYTSINEGENWTLEPSIPNVPVHQLKYNAELDKLYFYTHGRGIWSAELELDVATEELKPKDMSLKIWPNPTVTELNFSIDADFEPIRASILSMTGQEFLSFDLSKNQRMLRLSELRAGAYILWLRNTSGRSVSRGFYKAD